MDDKTIHDPYAALALAVIYHAMQDIESKNPAREAEARAWLQFVGRNWCQMLGVSDKELEEWSTSDFELPPSAHRNWRY